jgi:pilus assembly protein Flp/PilA
MATIIARLIREDEGADLIEYALLAGLISLVSVLALTSIGTNLSNLYSKINTKLSGINVQ